MANPFPFVSGDVLTAAELNGIGEAAAYTPTFTGFTLGNGTVSAKFVQVQKLVQVSVTITLGSTSSVTGQITITKPVTGATGASINAPVGVARLSDAGTANMFAFVRNDSTSFVNLRAASVSGANINDVDTSSTVPFTWANTDVIRLTFVYEAA